MTERYATATMVDMSFLEEPKAPRAIGYVGSRMYPALWRVRTWLESHRDNNPDVVVVSGGAPGVDREVARLARLFRLKLEEYPADWALHPLAAGFIRNTKIAERVAWLVAFWDGESTGTLDTMRKVKALGKRVTVIRPDGEDIEWNEPTD